MTTGGVRKILRSKISGQVFPTLWGKTVKPMASGCVAEASEVLIFTGIELLSP